MADFKWVRFGTATEYITGGNAPAKLLSLEDLPATFDGVLLRDFSLKAHSVLTKQDFWKDYFDALTIEYQDLVHHANLLKYIFDYKTYLGEETEFDKRIQNIYTLLGFPFSTSFGDYINADDEDFKYPDATKIETFFNKKIFWKQFTIENIVFLRKWLGSLYGYRQIFSSIFRRGGVFLTFKYDTIEFSENSKHRFRLFDSLSFPRAIPPDYGGDVDSIWPNTTTINGVTDYSYVNKIPYKFDTEYQFDGIFDAGVPGTKLDTMIAWDSGITASNTNKGISLEITCDRLLYHYNTLYNANIPEANNYCIMDLPWVDYILNLSSTIKKAADKVEVGSQITLITDSSNTITPYTGAGDDERIDYTHPNIRAKFQVITSKYSAGGPPNRIKIGTGSFIDWVNGSDPDEFFLKRGQDNTGWEAIWGFGGSAPNDIKNPVFEMSIGQYEREMYGAWDFIHSMVSLADFKNELLESVTLDINKFPAYYNLTITGPCTTSGNITIILNSISTTIALVKGYILVEFLTACTGNGNITISLNGGAGVVIALTTVSQDTVAKVATKVQAGSGGWGSYIATVVDSTFVKFTKTSGSISTILISATATVSWANGELQGHGTIDRVAKAIRDTLFKGWDVGGSDATVLFYPHTTGTYAAPSATIPLNAGATGVTSTCTGVPIVTRTVIELPHTYIAPGSVELRIEFTAGCFNGGVSNSVTPDDVTHTIIIKEIRQNNQWGTVSYVRSNFKTNLDNDSNSLLDYYNGYRDIIENDSLYYDSFAIDENGSFLAPYFRTQETTAFNLQDVDTDIQVSIDHALGEVVIAPQFIRNAFSISKNTALGYDGTGDRFKTVDVNIYCTYNLRAVQKLRDTAILGITEVGLFNSDDDLVAYASFPPIIYDSLKHHVGFNFFITDQIMAPISLPEP